MSYFNDDVAGLFTGQERNRNRGDVAGVATGRRNRTADDVAGAFDRRHKHDDSDELPIFDNFEIPVRVEAVIDSEEICRAVRRCLINDLVAGVQAEDDDNNDSGKKHRRR